MRRLVVLTEVGTAQNTYLKPNKSKNNELESETFWGRNQAEDLRFSLARRSAKATHSSTSFLSRL
jgi:hypothetical protein